MSSLQAWLDEDEEGTTLSQVYDEAFRMTRESLEDHDYEDARDLYNLLNRNFDIDPQDARTLYQVALENVKDSIANEEPETASDLFELAQDIRYDHGPRQRADDRESVQLKDWINWLARKATPSTLFYFIVWLLSITCSVYWSPHQMCLEVV